MSTTATWAIRDNYDQQRQAGCIEIVGPNGEAVCTLFPTAGKGGVGYKVAMENAKLICQVKGLDQFIEQSLNSGLADQSPFDFLDHLRPKVTAPPDTTETP